SSSPACLKTRRHQLSVLNGIPRSSPNSRNVNPLRCQRANSRYICRARTDVVAPRLPMNSFLRTHFALLADRWGRCTWSLSYEGKERTRGERTIGGFQQLSAG